MLRRRAIGTAGLVTLVGLLGCGGDTPRPNVVIVTFDTTRADHLGVYGGPAPTPHVRALAEGGMLFEHAYSPVPITLPAHSSLMTGRVPFAHGVRDNGLFALGDEQTTLAERLADAGYATGAAIGAFPLTAQFGIDQGFAFFDDHLTAPFEDLFGDRVVPKTKLFFDERPAGQVNAALLPWLDDHAEEPFFLWAHYFDPHHPLTPPAPYDQRHAHDLYAGEIAYADEALGELVDALVRHGVYDETIIVVTADHGEGRGEHNETTHSLLAYNTTLHVPLVIKPAAGMTRPTVTGQRFAPRVGLIDVMPTLLDWLGLAPQAEIQGRSLAPYLEPEATTMRDRTLYAETLSPRITKGWGELRALFAADWKYIHGPRPELFDLEADPREIGDLVSVQPEQADRMRRQLERYLEEHAVQGLDSSIALDEESARRLMALGYVQPSGVAIGAITETLSEAGDPPQDRASTIAMYSEAKQQLFDGRWLDAQENLERLLRLDPDNHHYMDLLALVASRLGNPDRALEILRTIPHDALVPTRDKVLEAIGGILLAQGDLHGALERYRDAQAIARTAPGQMRVAEIYRDLGDATLSERHLEQALEADATFAPARFALAVTLASRGDAVTARQHFERGLEDHPFSPRGHYNFAVFLHAQADSEAALIHVRRAIALAPSYHQAGYALVEMLLAAGREDEALDAYLTLAARAPSSEFTERAAALLGLDL